MDKLKPQGQLLQKKSDILLQVQNLFVNFYTDRGIIRACDQVDFKLYDNEIMAIVGESGSGKSVMALSIMGLIPDPPGKIINGKVLYHGEDLTKKTAKEMVRYRGNAIAMIFQDPMTSLDPVFTVEEQMVETILQHRKVNRSQARQIALDMLVKAHITDSEQRLRSYPFQLSGGIRQRVMIAMALSCQPNVLIADEPTTALDVTVQAQILSLLKELQTEFSMSVLLITHDFGVVSQIADRVVVMYAGKVMETASVKRIMNNALHPYTKALLHSMPRLGNKGRLRSISGSMPNLANPMPGCPFANRCSEMIDLCWAAVPELKQPHADHHVRCIRRG